MCCRKVCGETYLSKLSTVTRKSDTTTWLNSYFGKSEIKPSRKTNTHFENHFHHLKKIHARLVIQKALFSKNNNKYYNQRYNSISTKSNKIVASHSPLSQS